MSHSILIVDDKKRLCEILSEDFRNIGYRPIYATTGDAARKLFGEETIDVVLLDLKLGAENGLQLLREFLDKDQSVPIVMMTGYATIESAVEAIKLGAYDYIQKPVPFPKVQRVVENALKSHILENQNAGFRRRLSDSNPSGHSLSGAVQALYRQAEKIATTDFPVLLVGESGTGKELLADFIHNHSGRAAERLYRINCASLPASLLENELFGHEKGAYTGADTLYKGIFEQADGSSLFLDEIGDMPLELQAKILRTLQNHEVRRLGGQTTLTVDVRFIAATNKNVQELAKTGRFREDLYYRLNAAMFHVPPLREHIEDLSALISSFLAGVDKSAPRGVSSEVMDLFRSYDWPGNIRELKNVINFAAAISSSETIGIADLPPYLIGHSRGDDERNFREDLERRLIEETLNRTRYNKKRAAEVLRISRRTLYNKMEKYGIG